ncbi:hypothetical protein HDV00_007573 [Rhizophlyctis rosea]|nr:hypothetical protein HDV00_007573 [Rhizophlyctis rosea]
MAGMMFNAESFPAMCEFDKMNQMFGLGSAPQPYSKPLPASLEDLYKGTSKRLKVTRRFYHPITQQKQAEDTILLVTIKLG